LRNRNALLILFAALAGAGAHASAADKADLVKVGMIEKISRFIEWPGPPRARFQLCVSPDHPLLAVVKEFYEGAQIGDRPVDIQVIKRPDALAGCNVAFLGARELAELARVRTNADKDRVLLVAESSVAARNGVHVAFYSDMNRLRLEVNRKALEASGLKADYKFLEMAKIVE
jgi:hypothetical protein